MRVFLIAVALLTSAPALAQAPSAPAGPPCADPEFHRLDFWVGKWDVYPTGKDKLVAHSLTEKVYGCGVRQNWMTLSNQPGGSLSTYVPSEKRWEQFWIDSGGSRAFFTGGWDGKALVISGKWGGPIVRMSYSKNGDGSVRQFGEQSTDEGKTWAPNFDFTYKPAAATKP